MLYHSKQYNLVCTPLPALADSCQNEEDLLDQLWWWVRAAVLVGEI